MIRETLKAIPNGCFDAYKLKLNKAILSTYQEKVKPISQF